MAKRPLFVCALMLVLVPAGLRPQERPASSWDALDAQVADLYEKGDLTRAIEAAQASLRAAATPHETGHSLDRLGFLYYTSGNLQEGEKYLRESLQTRESAFGTDSLDYAETANDLAMLLRDQRRMDEARPLAERAVATREQRLGAAALPVAESLNTLGTVYGLSGNYADAVVKFERAMSIHEARPASERQTEEYGTLCINLAGTYQRLGKYDAAERTFRSGLDVLRVKPGPRHPAYATSELAYASLEVDLGHYSDAERLYDEGGRLVQAELGDQHPIYASFLNNRGMFYQSIGNFTASENDYRRSLDLKRTLYGPGSALATSTLRNLALLTYARDRRAGERLLAEAAAAYAQMPQAPPFDFTSTLVGLAAAQRDRGALSEARATIDKALEIGKTGLGDRHPLIASAMREAGLIMAAAGDDERGERQLREALAMAETIHGPRHPDVAGFLDALGEFYTARRNFSAALDVYRRSLDIQDRFASDVVEIGAESFKTASLASAPRFIARLIAFQAAAGDTLPAARTLAFEAVTRWKGRVVTQVAAWRKRLQTTASDGVRREAAEWQALVACRTSLTVALGYRELKPAVAGSCSLADTPFAGQYERLLSDLRSRWTPDVAASTLRAIDSLQARADTLETTLNRETGAASDRTVRAGLEDLRAQLGRDEALIEIVSYGSGDSAGGDPAHAHYGAFVLTGSGSLDWADLGAAQAVEGAVADLLAAARDWSVSLARAERAAADQSRQTAHQALGDLSARVWRPLAAIVDAHPALRRLRIAPDSSLNLVPFDALGDARPLIDRFAISYVPAGRDLLASTDTAVPGASVIVVSPGGVPGPASQSFRAADLARLANAEAEARDVRGLVPGAAIYSGANATEQRVKDLHAPAILHVVGHGVVRDVDHCPDAACASSVLSPSARAMSLAAIVLEEAYGRRGGSTEDGLLTASELENMDLRGTRMLVLSQCQMASGVASVGEGVYGMRRAALIAGAQTFVAPLWNVEDQVQRTLMKRFYEGVASGKTRADALRDAKLAIRSAASTRDFLYWAPEILSGAAGTLPQGVVGKN